MGRARLTYQRGAPFGLHPKQLKLSLGLFKGPHPYTYNGTDMAKKKPMKRPEKGGKPKRITTKGKPGDTGPGGARPARNRKKKKKSAK